MRWRRLGRIFAPDGQCAWMRTHAANGVARRVAGSVHRVYFGARDEQNRSSVGFVDIDLARPGAILGVSREALLGPGERGAFDDSGVSVGWIVEAGERLQLYYVGWSLGVTVPFRNSIGLAVGTDRGLVRVSRAPILDRSEIDPFSLSYPCVLAEADGWKMWYGSTVRWAEQGPGMKHVLKLARSTDGVRWVATGAICLDSDRAGEEMFARPSVVRDRGRYRMWYSVRGATYRIGYAESPDGVEWTRKDEEGGLAPSGEGWDSESVEYPFVFLDQGRTYMVYNGNGYGRTGLGLAVLDEP